MSEDAQKTTDPDIAEARVVHVRQKMKFRYKLLLFLVCIGLMAKLRTGFLFVLIAMLPCIVAYYFDASKHRYMFRSVFAANLAGFMPFFGVLMRHGSSNAALERVMGDGANWVIIYGAAFMGLMLVAICPMIAQFLIESTHRSQVTRYEQLQRKIEGEWGPEVTQFSKVPEEEDEL